MNENEAVASSVSIRNIQLNAAASFLFDYYRVKSVGSVILI